MNRDAILVVGSANMDMVVEVDAFPKPGETIFGREFELFPGGKGANQAVCCAKLNSPTLFIGKMGQDIFYERLSNAMRRDGVNLDYLLTDANHSTGVALISVDAGGENQIIVASGTNMQVLPEDLERQKQAFQRARVVLAQLEIPVETVLRAAQLAHQHKALFVLNPAPARQLPDELYRLCDYITPNETELEHLTGESIETSALLTRATEQLLQRGVKNVVVTLGAKGALWVSTMGEKRFSGISVNAVDTTAAGDAFNGAFCVALAQNNPIENAMHFANRVAAYTVTKRGAQTSMPTWVELESLL